jgi:hypothetical protein
MNTPLHTRIERRIRKIPASNGGYISVAPSGLGQVLSGDLLERIATEAAKEAQDYYHEQKVAALAK